MTAVTLGATFTACVDHSDNPVYHVDNVVTPSA